MDIKKIVSSVKKPWYVPAFIWNLAVNKVADLALEHVKVTTLASVVSDKTMTYLSSAVHDFGRREAVCRVVSGLGNTATAMSNALADGVVTSDESQKVGDAVRALLELAVEQETIDRTITEVREGLMA